MIVSNLETEERLRVELVDLPFAPEHSFRPRVNGRWVRKVPASRKTTVLRQLRSWRVSH